MRRSNSVPGPAARTGKLSETEDRLKVNSRPDLGFYAGQGKQHLAWQRTWFHASVCTYMMSARWVFVCMVLCAVFFCARADDEPELEISATSTEGFVEYDEKTGVVSDPAGVVARYRDVELVAQRLKFDRQALWVEAEGNARLQRGKEIWVGERLRYDFLTRQITAEEFRAGIYPFFAGAQGLHADITNQTHYATNAFLTTDNADMPGYRVRAKKIVFVPGKYIEAENAVLYLGKIPVLYLPWYRRHLDRHPNHFVLVPGYRSAYGPYLLTAYHWSFATNASVDLHLDYRVKRGIGGGPDLNYDLGLWGHGQVQTYFLHDEDPGTDPLNKRPIDPDRHRIRFAHSTFLRTNLSFKATVDHQSDALVAHDFMENEYRKNVQPRSFAEINQTWPNFSLSILAQPQVNDFFQTVERLPDIKFTGYRQQLGISPFYYESESSAAFLRFRQGDYFAATNHSAYRADTFHQLLVPQTLFGWFNVTPRASGRFTYYGAEEGLDLGADEHRRWVFNTGVETSFRAYRVWREARSPLLDITELRHIVEPSVNYSYTPAPSTRPPELPQFDYEWYSYEMRPIDFPDYNSVDGIDSQNVIRFGLHNKLQTKRLGQPDDLVNWGVFLDWRLRKRNDQATFADLFSDLDFKPRSWITMNSEVRYDINENLTKLANHTVTFEPNDVWSWKIGHRYVREIDELGPGSGHSLLLSSVYVRLSQNWAVRLRHHFDVKHHVMQEQYYTLYRDFRSWTGALTFRIRDDYQGHTDFAVAIQLSLKAFPRFQLGEDRDEPDRLLEW